MTNDGVTFVPNKVYNVVKYLVLIAIPAFSTAYFALGDTLGLPAADQVVKTLTVVAALLGSLVGLAARGFNSSDARFDGTLQVDETDTSLIHNLDIQTDPEQLKDQNEILLKVEKVTGS